MSKRQAALCCYRVASLLATILVFSISLLLPGNAEAEGPPTRVGGVIISDTWWKASESPYIVTAPITVAQGIALTVEPGVEVRFNSKTYLQVEGTLHAQGTASRPIAFTSSAPIPTPGDWGYIRFRPSSQAADFDPWHRYLQGSTLQYATVEYAGAAGRGAIWVEDAAPYIDHSIIRRNGASGIYAETIRPLYITNNIIAENSSPTVGGGIYAQGPLTIVGNQVAANRAPVYSGLFIQGDAVNLRQNSIVRNEVISTSSDKGGSLYFQGDGDFSCNTVVSNTAGTWGGVTIDGRPTNFVGNSIYGNTAYQLYNLNPRSPSILNAINNYWGTTDPNSIARLIYDSQDDATKDTVNYGSPLAMPAPCAPPSPPAGLVAVSQLGTVALSWKADEGQNIVGYRVYYSPQPGFPYANAITLDKTTAYTITSSVPLTYYLAVTAYDARGAESWYSKEISATMTVIEPVAPPAPVTIVGQVERQGWGDHRDAVVSLEGTPYMATTTAKGLYTITNVAPGIYTASATTPGYLPQKRRNLEVITRSSTIILPTFKLMGGDANGDGAIDIFDLVLMAANFGTTVPPAPLGADANSDHVVNIYDLVLAATNLDRTTANLGD
ncbi:MAG: carboxypeptidase regulatory-like domain-containing protein [Chloroflexi bacterium]|nr:carboxypeptidase regulatory-like domain-containing protein [Chloroflexota bacterium]